MWPVLLTFLFAFHLLPQPVQPLPVILDTDIGDDIDDTWAVGMLLGCPWLDCKLIVTENRETELKARLLAKTLVAMGRTDIPIGIGVPTPGTSFHLQAWLKDYKLDDFPGTVYEDGVQALIDTVHASPGPITIISIGPPTNLKHALARDPSIAKKAKIVAMLGSVRRGYDGRPKPVSEFNAKQDVAATKAVFKAPWPITLAPLDTCGVIVLRNGRYQRVRNSDSPLARTIIANYFAWPHNRDKHDVESSVLFDTEAIYLAFNSQFCRMEQLKLSVLDNGMLVEDPAKGRPVDCALDWLDFNGFKDFLVDCITGRFIQSK